MDDTLSQLQAGQLQGSTSLKLSCGLTNFPEAIYNLADTLEILDLTDNALSSLPEDLDRFKKLRTLFCSSNQFTEMPVVLGKCESLSMIGFKANQITHIPESAIPSKNLRWFIVTDNALEQLPDALGQCKKLQKLMLAGNKLSALPSTMANCHALELLRISANQFTTLPNWLFDLPKLTWLAYAGNPFSNPIEAAQAKQQHPLGIDWAQLTLGKVLGEGASGVTYQADWQHNGALESETGESETTEPVAVKLFKSGLTSDGLPSCEMHANIMAGQHPNLVGVKGIIINHPNHVQGLVMPLLSPDLKILAQPPSFESCSRDVYPADTSLSRTQANHIAQGVKKAMHHLHAKGLMHGDLYAHNILWNNTQVVLSDLGGASFLPMEDKAMANSLVQLDERAYQVLVEELANLAGANEELG